MILLRKMGNKGAEWLNVLTIITYNLKVLLFTHTEKNPLISSPPTEVISLSLYIPLAGKQMAQR